MRNHLLPLALLFGVTVLLVAQTRHITPFTGTWKMDVDRSRFNPGPPFKSLIITFAPDGTRTVELITADGQSHKAVLPWSDGKEVSVTATQWEHATATSKIQGKTFDDTWKERGKIVEQVHGVASSDGRSLTTTVDGTDGQGGHFHNQLTFEKQ